VRGDLTTEPPAHCRLVSDHDLFEIVVISNCTAANSATAVVAGGDGSPTYGGSAGFIPPIEKGSSILWASPLGVGHPIVGMCQIVAKVEGSPAEPHAVCGGKKMTVDGSPPREDFAKVPG